MKKLSFGTATLFVVVGCAGLAFAAQKGIKAGMYETVTTIEVVGVQVTPPPQTIQHCLSADEAADARKSFGKSAKDCTIKDQKTDGKKISFTMDCTTQKGNATGKGEVVFGEETMTSTFDMEIDGANHSKMKIIRKSISHRVGDCK